MKMRARLAEYVGLLIVFWSSVALTAQCPQHCRCRDANRYVDCSGQHLRDIPDLPVTALTVDLSSNYLGPVPDNFDVFARMPNLTLVDLSNNGLKELQGCIFRGLISLRTVILRGNRLARLPDNFFTDSKQVEHLDLSHNELTQLPAAIMSDMPNLKTLKLSHNQITNLTLTARFQVPKEIEYLDFSHNNISEVTEDSFGVARAWSPLVNRTVKMRFCGLKNVTAQGLSKIPSLTALDLTGNPEILVQAMNDMLKNLQTSKRLQNLSLAQMNLNSIDSLFTGVTELSLKLLNLSHNRIQDVREDVFQNTPSIQVLDVSYNQLRSLSQGFKNLRSLRSFNLSNNRMSNFSGDHVGHFSELRHLDLSHNMLGAGGNVRLAQLTKLETLDLSHNQMTVLTLPNTTTFLRHLDYRNNNVRVMGRIEDVSNLQYFDISGNKLDALPALLFKDGKFLKVANFSSNNISTLHEQTFMPQSPLVVDLSHNMLTHVRQVKWVATQSLNLRDNRLVSVDPVAFKGMNGLEFLDMSSNHLSHLDDNVFQHHISLKYLDLSKNVIGEVHWPHVLRNLESLLQLDLSFNKLNNLPEHTLERLTKVERVYLQNNFIKIITPLLFRDLNSLHELDLSSNPFECSCDMLAFRDWVKRKASIVLGLQDANSTRYQCHSPSSRAGLHIAQWDTDTLECNKSMLYAVIFGCIGVGLLLVGAIVSSVYRFYKRQKKARDEWKQKLEEKLEEEWKHKKKVDYVRMVRQEVADEIWNAITKRDRRHDRYQVLRATGYASDSAAHDARRHAEKERRYRHHPEKSRSRPGYSDIPSGQESDYVNFGRYHRDSYGNPIANYRKESGDSRIFYTVDNNDRNRTGRPYPARDPVTGWQDREGWEWSKQWMLQERARRADYGVNGYLTTPTRGREETTRLQHVYNDHYQPEVRFDQAMPRRHSRAQEHYMPRSKSYNYLPQDYHAHQAAVRVDQPGEADRQQENPDQREKGRKIGRAVSQPYLSNAGVSDWL